jgi:hypothetical protein
MHIFQVTNAQIHLEDAFTEERRVVMDTHTVVPPVIRNVYQISHSDRVPQVQPSVINQEIVILGQGIRGLSVRVQKVMKNRDFYATLDAKTKVNEVNTNTMEFSIGANPRVELASRRDSTIDGNALKGLKV